MINILSFQVMAGIIAANSGFEASSPCITSAPELTNPGLGKRMAVAVCGALLGDCACQRDFVYCITPSIRQILETLATAMDSFVHFRAR